MLNDFLFRLGIDLGGTKIEIALLACYQSNPVDCVMEPGAPGKLNNCERNTRVSLDKQDTQKSFQCVFRYRLATPKNYSEILLTIQCLVTKALEFFHKNYSNSLSRDIIALGVGLPGKIINGGIVQNSNTVCLNGENIHKDLSALLPDYLRSSLKFMNDANCFALSEALQGAALQVRPQACSYTVFAVILGTGVGGGVVIDGQLLIGKNSIGGEWGHNILPEPALQLLSSYSPQPRPCYCGNKNCIETYLSGAGFVATYHLLEAQNKACGKAVYSSSQLMSVDVSVPKILDKVCAGDSIAVQTLSIYTQQLSYALAVIVNILDPDVIVLGGGLSNIPKLAEQVEEQLEQAIFSSTCSTSVRRAELGDSSGVFGAAFLPRKD